jgi:hypothetical protein
MEDLSTLLFIIAFIVVPAILNILKKRKEKKAREEEMDPMENPARPTAARVSRQPRPVSVSSPQQVQQTAAGRTRMEPEPVLRDVKVSSQSMKGREQGMRSWQKTEAVEPEIAETLFSEDSFMEEMFGLKKEQPQRSQRKPAVSQARPKKVQTRSAPVKKEKLQRQTVPIIKQEDPFMKPAAKSPTLIDFASLTGKQLKKNIVLMEVLGSPRSKRMPGPGGVLPRIF